jgi:hypothetical protein
MTSVVFPINLNRGNEVPYEMRAILAGFISARPAHELLTRKYPLKLQFESNMKFASIATLCLANLVVTRAAEIEKWQSCPKVHAFGARETTVSAGYGTAGGLINQIKAAFPGSNSEAIVYPACGGQASCGGVSYDRSQSQGTAAVVKAVTAYVKKCPKTQIVLVGYSQVSEELAKQESTYILREAKSWITLSVGAQARLSLVPLLMPSRLPFSWATQGTLLVLLTMLGHAKLKEYVANMMHGFGLMLMPSVCCSFEGLQLRFCEQDQVILRLGGSLLLQRT